jgi:ABC-type dipeptide/oligopeptide/nickel transport system permease component
MFKLIRNRLAISIPMLFLVTALVFILQSFSDGQAWADDGDRGGSGRCGSR